MVDVFIVESVYFKFLIKRFIYNLYYYRNYICTFEKCVSCLYDKLKVQDDKFYEELVKSIPIKIGTIIKRSITINSQIYGSQTRTSFYKVIRFKPNIDGTAYIIVNKRKLDGNFGVRELTLCLISYHNDFKLENSYKIVDECM